MFVTVWIRSEQREGVVIAPLDAFVYRDDRPVVFVAKGEPPVARVREVTLGSQGFEGQQVTGGVNAGDRLVTEGRFQVSDGAPLDVFDKNAPKKLPRPAAGGGQ